MGGERTENLSGVFRTKYKSLQKKEYFFLQKTSSVAGRSMHIFNIALVKASDFQAPDIAVI